MHRESKGEEECLDPWREIVGEEAGERQGGV